MQRTGLFLRLLAHTNVVRPRDFNEPRHSIFLFYLQQLTRPGMMPWMFDEDGKLAEDQVTFDWKAVNYRADQLGGTDPNLQEGARQERRGKGLRATSFYGRSVQRFCDVGCMRALNVSFEIAEIRKGLTLFARLSNTGDIDAAELRYIQPMLDIFVDTVELLEAANGIFRFKVTRASCAKRRVARLFSLGGGVCLVP
jgi:hypothetical protein